ncbi:MAG: prolipoprotein diacylglyceryl transferase [Bacteroidota bacterium]|nr:prolipoprotein diacylglyceryl transferase [Bacteroidota bacterium]
MLLNYIHWNINPEIFHLGSLSVRWYGLLFASAFAVGYVIMQKMFEKEGFSIALLDKLSTYMLIATVIGARLGHVLFYQPEYYFAHPWEILKIWHGGLASHGAGIGIVFALWLFSRNTGKKFLWIMDRIGIVVALAGGFIRTGNLINSEIYGAPTDVPWAFIFENSDRYLLPRHPTQIYEALGYLAIFIVLIVTYYKKNGKPQQGLLFSWFLILLFGLRFVVEFFKADQVAFEQGMLLNMGQLLSIPFVLAGIGLMIYSYLQQNKTDNK